MRLYIKKWVGQFGPTHFGNPYQARYPPRCTWLP